MNAAVFKARYLSVREPGVRIIKRALNKNVTLFSHLHGHMFYRYKDESRYFHQKTLLNFLTTTVPCSS